MQNASKKPHGQIKQIQSEHYSKLLAKQNNEAELLEDIRSFCKQRALIDKEYGQALQKLCNSFLSKKEFLALQNPPEYMNRNVWDIWKSFLRTFNQLAISRVKSAEEYHRLSLELKPMKTTRGCVSKRIFKQLKALHNDLSQSTQEMVKSQKIYSEEEKQAHESRTKALSAEEKLRRRSTNLFSSMAQLHRNHAELSVRREECENRSTSARNEYLFQLTAINAHLEHYIKTDVPELAQILDGNVYDKFREVLTTTSQTELEICRHHQEPLQLLLSESATINRANAWNQFIKESPVFSDEIQIQFEPRDGDVISVPLSVNSMEGGFDQVAKKLVRRFVMRERRIKCYHEEIENLRSGRSTPPLGMDTTLGHNYDNDEGSTLNQEYVEHKVEELEFAIRRQEIEKKKIEACLDLLKRAGVDVKSALVEAYVEAESYATVLAESKQQCSLGESNQRGSIFGGLSSTTATGSSSTDGSIAAVDASITTSCGNMQDTDLTSSNKPRGVAGKEYSARLYRPSEEFVKEAWTLASTNCQQRTSNHAQTFNEQQVHDLIETEENHSLRVVNICNNPHRQPSSSPEVDWSGGGMLPKATALYEFLATHKDELNLVQNEKVVLLGPGDGEEWVQVRSLLDGNEGLVPRTFLCIDSTPPPLPPLPPTPIPLTVPTLVSTATDTFQPSLNLKADAPNSPPPPPPLSKNPSPAPRQPISQSEAGQFVRALIGFQGTEIDELSFAEGDIVHVLGRSVDEASVDDGWLEGELVPSSSIGSSLKGSVVLRGFFPSMFVKPFQGNPGDPAHWKACLEEAKLKTEKTSTDKKSSSLSVIDDGRVQEASSSNPATKSAGTLSISSKHRSIIRGGSQNRSASGRRSDQSRSRQQQKNQHYTRQHKPRSPYPSSVPQSSNPQKTNQGEVGESPFGTSSSSVDGVVSSSHFMLVETNKLQPPTVSTSTWMPSDNVKDTELRIAEV